MNNSNTGLAKLITKAITDATFRKQFPADPMGTALRFGPSDHDPAQLANIKKGN